MKQFYWYLWLQILKLNINIILYLKQRKYLKFLNEKTETLIFVQIFENSKKFISKFFRKMFSNFRKLLHTSSLKILETSNNTYFELDKYFRLN